MEKHANQIIIGVLIISGMIFAAGILVGSIIGGTAVAAVLNI